MHLLSINLFSNTSLGVLSLIHDAKVRGFLDILFFLHPKTSKKCLILDSYQAFVCVHTYFVVAHNSFSILFVSSTNSGIESCSGRRVITSCWKKPSEAGC